jgi:Zn-finger nucleic acid-binding protein
MPDDRVCPVDATPLRRIERSGVQVDACPSCRGIWLDRGELDKIVARESADADDFEAEIGGGRRDPEHESRSESGGYGAPHKTKRKRSILEDFLDFG